MTVLNGNSIFTLKVENRNYTILAGPYQEIYAEAQELANYFKKPISIYCHGTASIFATVTHLQ